MIRFTIPGLRLVSEANAHAHWRQRQKRAGIHRESAHLLTAHTLTVVHGGHYAGRSVFVPPASEAWLTGCIAVTITRIAPSKLDSDNLVGSAKAIRDGVADALCVNDRDERVTWIVEQRRGAVREYAVEIRIAPRAACPTCGAAMEVA